eukprot:2500937-Rhodomonas_salina.3
MSRRVLLPALVRRSRVVAVTTDGFLPARSYCMLLPGTQSAYDATRDLQEEGIEDDADPM